ncbi:MAG: hypothetical protein LQ345_002679 [Seirophora villosa]|nr:MAG: hypothetical protein LQ345_002679 [Seirophora villosa]
MAFSIGFRTASMVRHSPCGSEAPTRTSAPLTSSITLSAVRRMRISKRIAAGIVEVITRFTLSPLRKRMRVEDLFLLNLLGSRGNCRRPAGPRSQPAPSRTGRARLRGPLKSTALLYTIVAESMRTSGASRVRMLRCVRVLRDLMRWASSSIILKITSHRTPHSSPPRRLTQRQSIPT